MRSDLLGLALAAAASIARAAGPEATPALTVAVEDAAAPWSAADGTGLANDLVRAAFAASDVRVELVVVPYERCKRMVVKGEVAACFSMSIQPGLEPDVAFPSAPLFSCSAQYYEAVRHPVGVRRQEELPRGTVVGTVLDYEYPAAFLALERRGVVKADPSVNEVVALRRLAAGRVALALVNVDAAVKTAPALLRRAGVEGAVREVFAAGRLQSYIGFSRRHPRGAFALARFEEGFRRIQKSGRAGEIVRAWRERAAAQPGAAP